MYACATVCLRACEPILVCGRTFECPPFSYESTFQHFGKRFDKPQRQSKDHAESIDFVMLSSTVVPTWPQVVSAKRLDVYFLNPVQCSQKSSERAQNITELVAHRFHGAKNRYQNGLQRHRDPKRCQMPLDLDSKAMSTLRIILATILQRLLVCRQPNSV